MLALVAAAIRIPTLGEQSYWFDEGRTIQVIHTSFVQMLRNTYVGETTPEVYFVLAWLWAHISGYGAFSLRFLSAVCGVLTVPVGYQIGRRLSSSRAGVIVAALTACNPMLIWYSQEARCYSLLVLLCSLGFLWFIKLYDGPDARRFFTWAALAALSLWTHYFAALIVIPEAAWLLWRYRRTKSAWLSVALVAIAAGLLAPQALAQSARQLPDGGWISTVPLATRAPLVLVEQLLGPSRIVTPVTLTIELVVVGLGLLAICRNRELTRKAAPAWLIVAAGTAILTLSVLSGHDLLDPRNVLPLWMPAMVTIAIGLSSYTVGDRWLGALVAACATGVITAIAVDVTPRLQRPAWSELASAIEQRPAQVVFEAYGCRALPLDLYLPVHSVVGTVRVTSLDVISTRPQPSKYDVLIRNWYSVCAQFTRPVQTPAVLDGFRRVGHPQQIGQFTLQRYSSPVRHPVTLSMFSSDHVSTSGILMSVDADEHPLL